MGTPALPPPLVPTVLKILPARNAECTKSEFALTIPGSVINIFSLYEFQDLRVWSALFFSFELGKIQNTDFFLWKATRTVYIQNSMQTTLWLFSMQCKSKYLAIAKLNFICTSPYCQIAKISNCDFKIWAKISFLDKPKTLKGNDFFT